MRDTYHVLSSRTWQVAAFSDGVGSEWCFRQPNFPKLLYILDSKCGAQSAPWASLGSCDKLGPYPRPTESEPVF